MPMAEIDGGDIHYTQQGSGSPFVMLLPQSSGPVGVTPFLETLAQDFTVIRYDQRGTGQSAPVSAPDGMSMAGRAAEMIGLLDALGLERATLCCHSTGCGIGLSVVSEHPARVERLVLVSPWGYAEGYLTTMQQLRIAAARALNPYRYAWFNASLLYPPEYRRKHEAGFEQMAVETAPQDADQIEARLNAILSLDTRPITPSVGCPTLIVTGQDDQLMPAWFGREMAEIIPGARLVALDGGGHMLPETRGDEIANAIADFLRA
ncbi:MAG: alpha/beta fold hydrolase [Alphaproteobacteria bacterium]|nr:alpha/beta fold hydrolase [Alphaproteobacteria bacterium]